MAAYGTEAIPRFQELREDWRDAYRRVLLSYIAYKSKEKWKLGYAVAIFQSEALVSTVQHLTVITPLVRAERLLLDAKEESTTRVIDALLSGVLELGETRFPVCETQEESLSPYLFLDHPSGMPASNARTPALMITGNTRGNMSTELDFEEINHLLHMNNQPFDGIDDVIRSMGLREDIRSNAMRRIDIILNTPADIILAKSRISDGEAHIVVGTTPSISPQDLHVGLRIPQQNTDATRLSVSGSTLNWSSSGQWNEGHTSISVGDAKYVQAFLSLKGHHVSKWWLSDPTKQINHRATIQRFFDPEDKRLRRLVFPQRTESRDLEKGVALLLGVHGFNVMHYGEKESMQEGPDLIAETPSNRILILECATELPNIGAKLAKLKVRTARIVERLAQENFSHLEVLPAIVVTLTRAEIGSQSEIVGKEEIALVSKENLEELIQRLTLPANPEALFDEAKRLIPTQPFPNK